MKSMSTNNCLSIIGLTLDMLGVVLIFFFGISPKLDTEGNIYIIAGQVDEQESKKAKMYKKFSWFGLALVFICFALQLLGYLTWF
jgi:hypothetical protein